MMDAIHGVLQAQDQQRQMIAQTSVLKKSLDTQKSVGEAVVALIDQANPSLATNKTPGLGSRLDVCG